MPILVLGHRALSPYPRKPLRAFNKKYQHIRFHAQKYLPFPFNSVFQALWLSALELPWILFVPNCVPVTNGTRSSPVSFLNRLCTGLGPRVEPYQEAQSRSLDADDEAACSAHPRDRTLQLIMLILKCQRRNYWMAWHWFDQRPPLDLCQLTGLSTVEWKDKTQDRVLHLRKGFLRIWSIVGMDGRINAIRKSLTKLNRMKRPVTW